MTAAPSMMSRKSWGGGLAALLLVVCGCAPKGPEIVPISGTALRSGKPVPNIELMFYPASGRPSWGVTDEAGRFSLHYSREQEGALVGRHKVTVRGRQPQSAAEEFAGTITAPPEIGELRAKFGSLDTTPLVIEITKRDADLQVVLD
jgi:hypothetical protein